MKVLPEACNREGWLLKGYLCYYHEVFFISLCLYLSLLSLYISNSPRMRKYWNRFWKIRAWVKNQIYKVREWEREREREGVTYRWIAGCSQTEGCRGVRFWGKIKLQRRWSSGKNLGWGKIMRKKRVRENNEKKN